MQTLIYHGIKPSDPGGRMGLRNPERGWRIETVFARDQHAHATIPFHLQGRIPPRYDSRCWSLDAQHYKPFGLTLAQCYCYLSEFCDTPISDHALDLIQADFDRLRRYGLKAVFRFAYEADYANDKRPGPSGATILRHLDQLEPMIRRNADVILVLQAGLVGLWGEWHSSIQKIEKDHELLGAIMTQLLQVLPTDRMTQVRVPKYKRWILESAAMKEAVWLSNPAARIGYHNDGFLAGTTDGGTWPESPHFANPGNPEFDVMTRESPFLPVDGELFWSNTDGAVDGFRAAVRLRLHHYTSFSLAHSYSEREGNFYSIDDWMRAPLTRERAIATNLPVSDGYFEDGQGRPVERTIFEYITDHLGYRLELQQAMIPETITAGAPIRIEATLINRGFSTLHNPRPVLFVLFDDQERVFECPIIGVDPCCWQPHKPGDSTFAPLTHTIQGSLSVPPELASGYYQVGIWMPDGAASLRADARYAVRMANRDTPWWTDSGGRYGVNVLGLTQVV